MGHLIKEHMKQIKDNTKEIEELKRRDTIKTKKNEELKKEDASTTKKSKN